MCRAFLSPYYERGGFNPADEEDIPVFIGRFNIGAISLHLPMILAKSRKENKNFYEVLDYYLDMIVDIHLRTREYLGNMKASCNPLAYCEGGFYGGHLNLHDKIEPLMKYCTASFGITALNELNMLYNGKSIYEDGEFPLEVMNYINKKKDEYTKKHNLLFAIYGTPAENLCFDGDTIVQAYPNNKKIRDIVEGDVVYSFNEDLKKIELKRVIASKRTNSHAIVMKISFDTGQEIICTPNHPFAIRRMNQDNKGIFSGGEYIEWVEAQNLKIGDRCKSNYFDDSTGYIRLSDEQKRCNLIYSYFSGSNIPEGYVVHHKDENKLNDIYENFELMTSRDHKVHHMKGTISKYSYTTESQRGVNNSFYGRKHSEESKEKNRQKHLGKHPWNWIDPQKVLELYNQGLTYEEIANKFSCKVNTIIHKLESVGVELNHKIVSIEYLDELHETYNIEVEDNHNYYVGGNKGILVHNCGLQVKQFREKYGIIEGVSDRDYVSNSFHCHVTEDITPIEKQNSEGRFWDLFNGGKIQYVRYPINYNKKAIKTLLDRAMSLGYYEGVNLALSYCNDCGYQSTEMDIEASCPKCGNKHITRIDRMCGYLSMSRGNRGDDDSRFNSAKMSEIKERKSM